MGFLNDTQRQAKGAIFSDLYRLKYLTLPVDQCDLDLRFFILFVEPSKNEF
ncbi:MAG: hypothetical protein JAY69_11170 [Candidatus Thiodiazotropha taylori]|nr:hypothetical protein [Candidatus Thiodiazotropha taylori]MCW4233176.1 hypothetical protein [Candidatus Thiodiazotropha taylori]